MISEELKNIHSFLLGEFPLEGYWFGDKKDSASFWWRRNLRTAITNSESSETALKERIQELEQQNKELRELIENVRHSGWGIYEDEQFEKLLKQ